ncbi:MAG: hypothetical protein SGPRY_008141, partial [Prymnesium sp.]
SQSNENISPGVIMNVAKELRKLSNEPLDGIKVSLNEEDVTEIVADITGPGGTLPFTGEPSAFFLCDGNPAPYYLARPQCVMSSACLAGFFLTKIFHPNISNSGEICVNTLKKDWKTDLGIGHVLQVVRCLLINPFPESALNDEAAKMFMEEYGAYCKKARLIADVHAMGAGTSDVAGAEATGKNGEPFEKRQKPVENKAVEKRRLQQKKALKRLLCWLLLLPRSSAFLAGTHSSPHVAHRRGSSRSHPRCQDAQYVFEMDESSLKFGCQQRSITMVRPEPEGSLYEFVTSDPGAIVSAAWGEGAVTPSKDVPGELCPLNGPVGVR